jgi:hypothetical protein
MAVQMPSKTTEVGGRWFISTRASPTATASTIPNATQPHTRARRKTSLNIQAARFPCDGDARRRSVAGFTLDFCFGGGGLSIQSALSGAVTTYLRRLRSATSRTIESWWIFEPCSWRKRCRRYGDHTMNSRALRFDLVLRRAITARNAQRLSGRATGFFLIAFLATASRVEAWHATGHTLVADVAYTSCDQETRARVIAVLRHHPMYSNWVAERGAAGLDDEATFEEASLWPDKIRGTVYSHPAWHFIDWPVSPEGRPGPAPLDENLRSALLQNIQALRDPTFPPADRAISLCWIMHLVGDAHQPLHAATLVSLAFPEGDRGGNLFRVVTGDKKPTNLHAIWDGAFDSLQTERAWREAVPRLMLDHPQNPTATSADLSPQVWIAESVQLAKTVVYAKELRSGTPTPIPEGYLLQVRKTAAARITSAGYRLARLLQDVLAQPSPSQ